MSVSYDWKPTFHISKINKISKLPVVITCIVFLLRYLGNMDETPVFFNMVPGKTIDVRGKKTIKVRTTGSEKQHITVVLACMASG